MLSKLLANRNLLKNLVLRDLKYRYVGSVGGFLWSVVHPLVQLLVYTFVFKALFNQPLGPEYGVSNFSVFLFCGLLPWILFSDTVVRSCSSITENSQLITKTVIPAEILPISITLSNLINHGIGLSILLLVLAIFFQLHLSALLILVYIPMLLMLALGLGWIAAGLQVFLRDTSQALQILMFVWWWVTPGMYVMEGLPPWMQRYLRWNPMATIVTGYRNSLLHLKQPDLLNILLVFLTSLAVFVLGAFLFRQAKPAFPDVL
jgi:lipopolysaccharide transport system permease protein